MIPLKLSVDAKAESTRLPLQGKRSLFGLCCHFYLKSPVRVCHHYLKLWQRFITAVNQQEANQCL